MPLTNVEIYPKPGLGWLNFLVLPSKRQTEKAKRELLESQDKEFIFAANPLAVAFSEGRLGIGTFVRIDGRTLSLYGVYRNSEYPEAMVFWDQHRGCYVQFTNFMGACDYEIISQ